MKYMNIKKEELVEENGFIINKKGVLIQYEGFDKHVVIPRKIKGITVTSIGDGILDFMGIYAFYGHSNLVSIIIPDSITSIGNSAFSFCENLTSITIPNSVTSIGDSAFGGCSNLMDITISEGVISIGNSAFAGCSNLTNIRIPSSVTFIGEGIFSSCFNLKDIIVDKENVTFMSIDGILLNKQQHSLPFYPAEKPDTSYTIPDGVKIIGNAAFRNCDNLKNITLPSSVTTIGERAFSGCYGLKNISLSEGITTIGKMAFLGCYNLTNITIPDSVITIENTAFHGCENLRSITIPAKVSCIEHGTFGECNSLESIFIYNDNIDIDEIFEYTLGDREKTTIYAHEGSTTEKYAKRKGYKFITLT